jgi:hypothetical protein
MANETSGTPRKFDYKPNPKEGGTDKYGKVTGKGPAGGIPYGQMTGSAPAPRSDDMQLEVDTATKLPKKMSTAKFPNKVGGSGGRNT